MDVRLRYRGRPSRVSSVLLLIPRTVVVIESEKPREPPRVLHTDYRIKLTGHPAQMVGAQRFIPRFSRIGVPLFPFRVVKGLVCRRASPPPSVAGHDLPRLGHCYFASLVHVHVHGASGRYTCRHARSRARARCSGGYSSSSSSAVTACQIPRVTWIARPSAARA